MAWAMLAPVIGSPASLEPIDDLEVLLLGDRDLRVGYAEIVVPGTSMLPPMEVGPGTRVLVTGASRGIGAAVARAFAARGCTLGVVARGRGPLEELAAGLPERARGPRGRRGRRRLIASAVERFGDVDVLVANAGLTHYMPFAELPLESAEQMSRVNWLGTLYTVKAALPRMLERRRGHVVIVSSGGGVRGFPEAAVYNGTKAAQRGFAEALAWSWRAAAYRSPPSTRARSRPPCTTTNGIGCPPGITAIAARRQARSPIRW